MKKPAKTVVVALTALGALVADIPTHSPLVVGFVPEAHAIIGLPFTPLSFAGVARRTTRRALWAGAAVAATTPVVVNPAPVVVNPAPVVVSGGSVPIGTVVSTLPAGCTKTAIGGTEYHLCAGTYYRAAFQGNNLVYVSTQP